MAVVRCVFSGIVGKSISWLLLFIRVSPQYSVFLYFASFHRVRFSVQFPMYFPVFVFGRANAAAAAWYMCVCLCVGSSFLFIVAYFHSFILRVCLASCLNIATFVFICVFAYHVQMFHISFPCIFSIYFVFVVCSLKFRRFRLSCSQCVQTVCIFIIFVVFRHSFFLSSSRFFLVFSLCFFCLAIIPCVFLNISLCAFLFCPVFRSVLLFLDFSCISIASNKSIYIFVDYSVISSVDGRLVGRIASHSAHSIISLSLCLFLSL